MVSMKEFLHSEIRPALGCTEPVCVALVCAHAGSLIPGRDIESIDMSLSPGLYKNGIGVFLPGGSGEKGLYMAASLGAICGVPEKDLEVLSGICGEDIKKARQLVSSGKVTISVDYEKSGIFASCKINGRGHLAEATISDMHNMLTTLKLDGKELLKREKGTYKNKMFLEEIVKWVKSLSCDEIFFLIDKLDDEDFVFLKQGVEMNVELAEEGLRRKWGYSLSNIIPPAGSKEHDLFLQDIKRYTLAAVDARMGGCFLPAMSSAGSGNNGIVATLPLWVIYSKKTNISERDFLRCVALSHLLTSKLKAHMGRITPVCSCGLSAGGAIAGSISYLLTKNVHISKEAIKNHLVSLFGILCDGAKPSCAMKIDIALSCAISSISFAFKGISISREEGICGRDLDETLIFLEELTSTAYSNMDSYILNIMTRK